MKAKKNTLTEELERALRTKYGKISEGADAFLRILDRARSHREKLRLFERILKYRCIRKVKYVSGQSGAPPGRPMSDEDFERAANSIYSLASRFVEDAWVNNPSVDALAEQMCAFLDALKGEPEKRIAAFGIVLNLGLFPYAPIPKGFFDIPADVNRAALDAPAIRESVAILRHIIFLKGMDPRVRNAGLARVFSRHAGNLRETYLLMIMFQTAIMEGVGQRGSEVLRAILSQSGIVLGVKVSEAQEKPCDDPNCPLHRTSEAKTKDEMPN